MIEEQIDPLYYMGKKIAHRAGKGHLPEILIEVTMALAKNGQLQECYLNILYVLIQKQNLRYNL